MADNIYVAGPLFNPKERQFNEELRDILNPFFDVFLPQEDAGMREDSDPEELFREDIEALDECDYLLIVLDGAVVDDGAAFELGYAYSEGVDCYGLQTDDRRLLPEGNNLMIENACKEIFQSKDELAEWAENRA